MVGAGHGGLAAAAKLAANVKPRRAWYCPNEVLRTNSVQRSVGLTRHSESRSSTGCPQLVLSESFVRASHADPATHVCHRHNQHLAHGHANLPAQVRGTDIIRGPQSLPRCVAPTTRPPGAGGISPQVTHGRAYGVPSTCSVSAVPPRQSGASPAGNERRSHCAPGRDPCGSHRGVHRLAPARRGARRQCPIPFAAGKPGRLSWCSRQEVTMAKGENSQSRVVGISDGCSVRHTGTHSIHANRRPQLDSQQILSIVNCSGSDGESWRCTATRERGSQTANPLRQRFAQIHSRADG